MSSNKIQCPTCMELIDASFSVCTFCGEDLSRVRRPAVDSPSATSGIPVTPQPSATYAPPVPPAPPVPDYRMETGGECYDDDEPAGFFKTFVGREYFGRYASFEGLTSRANYWFTVLALAILEFGFYGLFGMLIGFTPLMGFFIGYALCAVIGMAFLVPSLAICARRLRDAGKNPWLLLLGLIPLAGPIILLVFFCSAGRSERRRFSFKAVDMIITVLCLIMFIAGVIMALRGVSSAIDKLTDYEVPHIDEPFDDTDYETTDDDIDFSGIEAVEEAPGTYTLTGTVAGIRVIVEMLVDGETVSGRLRYAKINPPAWLEISGFVRDGYYFSFQETNDNGEITGDYSCEGAFDSRGRLKALKGSMVNYKGKTYTVDLHVQ